MGAPVQFYLHVDVVRNCLELSYESPKFQIYDSGVDESEFRRLLPALDSVMKQAYAAVVRNYPETLVNN